MKASPARPCTTCPTPPPPPCPALTHHPHEGAARAPGVAAGSLHAAEVEAAVVVAEVGEGEGGQAFLMPLLPSLLLLRHHLARPAALAAAAAAPHALGTDAVPGDLGCRGGPVPALQAEGLARGAGERGGAGGHPEDPGAGAARPAPRPHTAAVGAHSHGVEGTMGGRRWGRRGVLLAQGACGGQRGRGSPRAGTGGGSPWGKGSPWGRGSPWGGPRLDTPQWFRFLRRSLLTGSAMAASRWHGGSPGVSGGLGWSVRWLSGCCAHPHPPPGHPQQLPTTTRHRRGQRVHPPEVRGPLGPPTRGLPYPHPAHPP